MAYANTPSSGWGIVHRTGTDEKEADKWWEFKYVDYIQNQYDHSKTCAHMSWQAKFRD